MILHRLSLGRMVAFLGLATLMCFASITRAFADVMAPLAAASSIDLSPFVAEVINVVIMIGAPAVASLLLWLLVSLQRMVGLRTTVEQDYELRAKVDQALFQAAAFARERSKAAGPLNVDVGSVDLAIGARYAMNAIPDTLKKLGITDAASQRLKDMVEARLSALPA